MIVGRFSVEVSQISFILVADFGVIIVGMRTRIRFLGWVPF